METLPDTRSSHAPDTNGQDTPASELARILASTAHRPYALPTAAWTMRQRWNDLLFAHYPVNPAVMASLIPRGLELDTFDRQAWLGVVPFWMDRVVERLPLLRSEITIPTVRCFAELNLRTYVRSPRTGKRGVFFFALECASPLAVLGARIGFHLPYFFAQMHHAENSDGMTYRSRRQLTRHPVLTDLTYAPTGPTQAPAAAGTLTHFLTERYCLFTTSAGKILCGDIHHEPWPLQPAAADFRQNGLPAAHGFASPTTAPVLHFSRALQVFIYPLHEDTA